MLGGDLAQDLGGHSRSICYIWAAKKRRKKNSSLRWPGVHPTQHGQLIQERPQANQQITLNPDPVNAQVGTVPELGVARNYRYIIGVAGVLFKKWQQ